MDGSRPSRGAERYDLCHPLAPHPVHIRTRTAAHSTCHTTYSFVRCGFGLKKRLKNMLMKSTHMHGGPGGSRGHI